MSNSGVWTTNASPWIATIVPNQTMTLQLTAGVAGPAGSGGGGSSNIELSFAIAAPVVETITIRGYSTAAGALTSVKNLKTASGTATVAITVDGTTVAGPITATTTPQNITLSAAISVGSVVKLVISAVSTPTFLEGTVLGVNGSSTNGFELSTAIPSPSTGTITLRGYSTRAGTLTGIKNLKTASGTATISVTVDGTTVSGSSLTASSSSQNASLSTNLSIGSTIQLVISGVSSASMLELTLIGTNT